MLRSELDTNKRLYFYLVESVANQCKATLYLLVLFFFCLAPLVASSEVLSSKTDVKRYVRPNRLKNVEQEKKIAEEVVKPSGSLLETHLDYPVAIVNQDVITHYDLREAILHFRMRLSQRNIPLPDSETLARDALEWLVQQRLLLQAAQGYGITISEEQLSLVISQLALANHMSHQEFLQKNLLEGQDVLSFRNALRDEMIVQQLREKVLAGKIFVADQEVDNFLEENRRNNKGKDFMFEPEKSFDGPKKTVLHIAHILIKIPENASPSRIKERREIAARILNRIQEGEDFEVLARQFSEASEAGQGGLMGWRLSDQYPELLTQAVSPLKPGEVGSILRSPAGFHIVKLIGRSFQDPKTQDYGKPDSKWFSEMRVRYLRLDKVDSSFESLFNRFWAVKGQLESKEIDFSDVLRGDFFSDLAIFSEDLGWIDRNDLEPALVQVTERMQPGEISEPVQVGNSLYLVQVLERRKSSVDSERYIRKTAKRHLIKIRTQGEFQKWLSALVDQSHIEYALGKDL